MGRKKEAIKLKSKNNNFEVNRDDFEIDFSSLKEFTQIVSSTKIIVENSRGTASKVTLGIVLQPLEDKISTLENTTAILSATKADKCFALAMSIVL